MGISREKAISLYYSNPRLCDLCGAIIHVRPTDRVCDVRKKKFCNLSHAIAFNNRGKKRNYAKPRQRKLRLPSTREELVSRGMIDPVIQRQRRFAQLKIEEDQANILRDAGYEVYSPTVVCDRIVVKDGKVLFVEFKKRGREKLRPGQKRINQLIPESYMIVIHD